MNRAPYTYGSICETDDYDEEELDLINTIRGRKALGAKIQFINEFAKDDIRKNEISKIILMYLARYTIFKKADNENAVLLPLFNKHKDVYNQLLDAFQFYKTTSYICFQGAPDSVIRWSDGVYVLFNLLPSDQDRKTYREAFINDTYKLWRGIFHISCDKRVFIKIK